MHLQAYCTWRCPKDRQECLTWTFIFLFLFLFVCFEPDGKKRAVSAMRTELDPKVVLTCPRGLLCFFSIAAVLNTRNTVTWNKTHSLGYSVTGSQLGSLFRVSQTEVKELANLGSYLESPFPGSFRSLAKFSSTRLGNRGTPFLAAYQSRVVLSFPWLATPSTFKARNGVLSPSPAWILSSPSALFFCF